MLALGLGGARASCIEGSIALLPTAAGRTHVLPSDRGVWVDILGIRARLILADALADACEFEESQRVTAQAVVEARRIDNSPLIAEALLRQGLQEAVVEDHAAAEKTLERAYWTAVGARRHELAALAASERTGSLAELDRYDEAFASATRARSYLPELGEYSTVVAAFHENLGHALRLQGKYRQALSELVTARDVLAGQADHRGRPSPRATYRLGAVMLFVRQFDAARVNFEQSAHLLPRACRNRHPLVIKSLTAVGAVHRQEGNLQDARRNYERALAIAGQTDDARALAAPTLNGLGRLAMREGRASDAVAFYQRALKSYEGARGPSHSDVALAATNLAAAYAATGDYDEALALNQRALEIRIHAFGAGHADTANSFENLGRVYALLDRPELAVSHHRQARRIRERQVD